MSGARGVILAVTVLLVAMSVRADSENSDPSFDLLLAPTSPGLILLGKTPSNVPRPSSVTDLAITILQQSDNLTTLPQDFALDIAPYPMFTGNTPRNNKFWETFLLSFASSNTTNTNGSDGVTSTTSIGLGFSVSLHQGEPSAKITKQKQQVDDLNNQLLKQRTNAQKHRMTKYKGVSSFTDTELDEDVRRNLLAMIDIDIAATSLTLEQKKKEVSETPYRRERWKLDCAGGIAVDFPGQSTHDSDLARWGLWLTGGYEFKRGAIIGVVRGLRDKRKPTDDTLRQSSLDCGVRGSWDDAKKTFTGSIEYVYREFLDRGGNQWRLALLVDYKVGKGKTLSLSFGRDFEGEQSGNLLALVNLLLGFGSQRSLPTMAD